MTDPNRGQEFLAQLAEAEQDLPYSPSLLTDLFSLTNEESPASMERIAQSITQDQGLTTKILALANSAFYGLQAKVTSVSRAAALLGLKEIRNLVLALGVQSLTRNHDMPPDFQLHDYWEHHLVTGVCAKLLSERTPGQDPDILFTAGMLHDFGKLLTAIHAPADWTAIHERMAATGISYSQAEEEHWAIEHGVIGAMTLNAWNLPRDLTEPVNWHHSPEHAPDHVTPSKLLCLADGLAISLRDPERPLPEKAVSGIMEFGFNRKEILTELHWVLEDDSLAQFIAHLS